MTKAKQKLELTRIGKENRLRLELTQKPKAESF